MSAYTAIIRQPGLRQIEEASSPERGAAMDWARANNQLAWLADTLRLLCTEVSVVEVENSDEHGEGGLAWSSSAKLAGPASAACISPLISYPPAAFYGQRNFLQIGSVIYFNEDESSVSALAELRAWAHGHACQLCAVSVAAGVRLRDGCAFIPPHWVILNTNVIDRLSFSDFEVVAVDAGEPAAADLLVVGRTAIVSAQATRTVRCLRRAGIEVLTVSVSEFQNLGIGLTTLASIYPA